MPARVVVPTARCPQSLHRRSRVSGYGTYTRADRRYRRYRCQPTVGDAHTFSTLIGDEGPPAPAQSALPRCTTPGHEHSRVVRAGKYAKRTARQRYRCYPGNGDPIHRFTPVLPREHVHAAGASCELCEERRGMHHGQTAVARGHAWPTPTVTAALEKLATGGSYGEVSKWALQSIGVSLRVPRRASPVATPAPAVSLTKPVKKRRRPSIGARLSRNAWHIAADWTEAFGPVIFGPIEERLRSEALAERARLDVLRTAGAPLDRPHVILLDDIPVYGREAGVIDAVSRRDEGFFLLVVAEVIWHDPGPGDPADVSVPEQKIRLVRAMAKSNSHSWRLVFDELGYTPDFVVADASTAIVAAVAAHYGKRAHFVPSLWHVGRAVRLGLEDTPGARAAPVGKRLARDLHDHLAELGRDRAAMQSVADWTAWWDRLDALLDGLGLPRDRSSRRRANYEEAMTAALPALLANPGVPMSTGGLEKLIERQIQPVLATRRAALANIERTNALLDLVVAQLHGAFIRPSRVTELLRRDAASHGGYTVALRSIADPYPVGGRYSSLRDPTLLASLARARGLA